SPVLLYLLFEHQSTSDGDIPLRLLKSMLRIWERHRTEYETKWPLPPIVPLVLHHSESGWHAPRDFHGMFDLKSWPEVLKRYVPLFEIVVDDISRIPESELLSRPLTPEARLALWMLE